VTSDFKEMLVKKAILEEYFVQAKIRPFILNGWSITGLFGHVWLHGGILHIVGNMLFLWIFGNAVCSKIGNIIYLPVYLLLGLIAGISHMLFTGGDVIGASGAINGIVGMYLIFFPINEITCYFLMIFLLRPVVKEFSLSSYWMILFWLAFDILGAMQGGGRVAYFAHLGGFAGGAILAILMLTFKLVKMEPDEKSLLQIISEFGKPVSADEFKPHYEGYLELIQNEAMSQPAKAVIDSPEPRTISLDPPIPLIPPLIKKPAPSTPAKTPQIHRDDFIRFACPCSKRLKMPAKFAGKMGKCPQCQNRVKIPDK